MATSTNQPKIYDSRTALSKQASTFTRNRLSHESYVVQRRPLLDGKIEEAFLPFFIPASCLKRGSTTIDRSLFEEVGDHRRLRDMHALYFHLCSKLALLHHHPKFPLIMSERVVVSSRGLPERLAGSAPDPAEMRAYVYEHPEVIAGWLWTVQFDHKRLVTIKTPQDGLREKRAANEETYKAVLEQFHKSGGDGRAPKKEAVPGMEQVTTVNAAMKAVFRAFSTSPSERKDLGAADLEFLKAFPRPDDLATALAKFTGDNVYLQRALPRVQDIFDGDKSLYNPLNIFTMDNTNLEDVLYHAASVADIKISSQQYTQDRSFRPTCLYTLTSRVRPQEFALDVYNRFLLPHVQINSKSFEEIKASIPVDAIIRDFVKDEAKMTKWAPLFKDCSVDQLNTFITKLPKDFTSDEAAVYTRLTRSLQSAVFEQRPMFYTGNQPSGEYPLHLTGFDILLQQNTERKANREALCRDFCQQHPGDEKAQREFARSRVLMDRKKALTNLVNVFKAGNISTGARKCWQFLEEYHKAHGNFYFAVSGGFTAHYAHAQQPLSSAAVSSASTSSVSSASVPSKKLTRDPKVAYDLPAFAKDCMAGFERFFDVAFTHHLSFEFFFRACHVFLHRPLHLHVLMSSEPGAGKSMLGEVLKACFPIDVVNNLTHESLNALAIPGCEHTEQDKIQILDEFGPEFMNPNSEKMRQLLSIMSGADYVSDILHMDKKNNDRNKMIIRVRDERLMFCFTNFEISQIYSAMRDRMTCIKLSPTAQQTDTLEKCTQRQAKKATDANFLKEKALFLERMQLIASLMCFVCKAINVGIFEWPDTSAGVDAYAAINNALKRQGLALGSNRRRMVALEIMLVACIMDAVLRIFTVNKDDPRLGSRQELESLLDVDPFLSLSPASALFAISMAHIPSETRDQSAVIDYICEQVFIGEAKEYYRKMSTTAARGAGKDAKEEVKEAKEEKKGDPSALVPYVPPPASAAAAASNTVQDEWMLQTATMRKRIGTATDRLASVINTSVRKKTATSVGRIKGILTQLQTETVVVTTPNGEKEVPVFKIEEASLQDVKDAGLVEMWEQSPNAAKFNEKARQFILGELQKENGLYVFDVYTMPTCVKAGKKSGQLRPFDAIASYFSNKFTRPGPYIFAMSENGIPASPFTHVIDNQPDKRVFMANPDYCPDVSVAEACLGLVVLGPGWEPPRFRDSLTEILECKQCPFEAALLNRLKASFLPPNTDKTFINAALNCADEVGKAILVSREEVWTAPRQSIRPVQPPALEAIDEVLAEAERRQRREIERKEAEEKRKAAVKPGSLTDLLRRQPIGGFPDSEESEPPRKRGRPEQGRPSSPSAVIDESSRDSVASIQSSQSDPDATERLIDDLC